MQEKTGEVAYKNKEYLQKHTETKKNAGNT